MRHSEQVADNAKHGYIESGTRTELSMEITRREAVKALMSELYALSHVSGVTPVKSETLFLLLTVNDGIEFDSASIKNMSEELRDVLAKSGCPNLPVYVGFGMVSDISPTTSGSPPNCSNHSNGLLR